MQMVGPMGRGAGVRSLVLMAVMVVLPLVVRAEVVETPYQVVQRVTDEVLKVVRSQGEQMEADPQAFNSAVNQVLEPVVAFDYIARGVMGNYAKEATPEQRQRFSEIFQADLVSTYARGLAIYSSRPISVDPAAAADKDQRRVSVIQRVKTEAGEHVLAYTMGLDRGDNRWKLLNVVINGVNLGNTFRSQFAQSMQKNGDLDAVIRDWGHRG